LATLRILRDDQLEELLEDRGDGPLLLEPGEYEVDDLLVVKRLPDAVAAEQDELVLRLQLVAEELRESYDQLLLLVKRLVALVLQVSFRRQSDVGRAYR